MGVKLENISFNYEDDLTKTGAFNLRRNETQIVRVPEWQPDLPSCFEASPAAYTIHNLPKQISIQASFKCEGNLGHPLMIRALAEPPDHLLGSIEPIEIPNSGLSGDVPIKLPHARISSVGVGIHDITWRWQYSDRHNVWNDFQTTFHRIYAVLELPSEPWKPKVRESSDIQQPWTEVLDYACLWAEGSTNCDEAASRLTENFFKLGEHLLRYESGGNYAFARFDCTNFLRLLKTGIGAQTVNCDDCATIVSTFANILGTELSQSGLGPSFTTNPVVLIGSNCFCATDFIYHSLAWKGDATANDEVFDGCLRIDTDVAPPLIAVQPVDLLFGNEKMGYRFSLVQGAQIVTPIPNHPDFGRRRRPLGSGYLAQLRITDKEVISRIKRIYDFDLWPEPKEERLQPITGDKTVAGVLTREPFVPGWLWHFGEHFQDERFLNVFQISLKPAEESFNKLLAINLYESRNAIDANENLIEILGRFEELKFKRISAFEPDGVGFSDSLGTIVLCRLGQWLFVVRSVGRTPFSVVGIVSALLSNFGTDDLVNNGNEEKEQSMAKHKLADLRHIFRIRFQGATSVIVPEGEIDISAMNESGHLDGGTHTSIGSSPFTITADATEENGRTKLRFFHNRQNGSFIGELTFDDNLNPNHQVVVGTFFPNRLRGEKGGVGDQQQEPWVITKP